MRQFRTATPNLDERVKSNIINLQNWVKFNSHDLTTRNLYKTTAESTSTYNYNELVESLDNDVEMYFSYRGTHEKLQLTIKLPYSKVLDILAVIKSKQFTNEDIHRKILRKFTK
jgi:hypothetical protein